MCLLHTHHADTKLSDAWIEDFYGYNGDGIGVMYSEPDEQGRPQLVVKKCVPFDTKDAIAFYNENIKGRECVVHWRMATHGNIDFDNCHPYAVLDMQSEYPLYLMHNGILRCGNAKDKAKSDTWHYVNDYLKPLLDPEQGGNPHLAFKEPFVEILGDAIGSSNKFALMDYMGNVSIINRADGVEWNGIWLSNTYAWSAPRRLSHNKYYTAAKGESPFAYDWMDAPEDAWAYSHRAAVTTTTTTTAAGKSQAGVIPIGGSKKSGKKRKNRGAKGIGTVIVDHAGKVKEVAAPHLDAQSLLQEKEVSDMFEILDSEHKPKAYTNLSFQNFYRFIDHTDLDAAWEAVYMLVDDVLDEDQFIDYILDPSKWTDGRPRLATDKTNIAGGEVDPLDLHREYADEDGVLYDADEVIEATLPQPSPQTRDEIARETVAKFTTVPKDNGPLDEVIPRAASTVPQIMPRPVPDQRANASIFDRAGSQGA